MREPSGQRTHQYFIDRYDIIIDGNYIADTKKL